MFAHIKLEHVADDIRWQHQHGGMNRDFDRWLRDWSKLGPDKSFTWVKCATTSRKIQGVPDYTNANSTGSRGVFYHYTLAPGLYEVNHRHKINKVRRYWLLSENGTVREIERDEAVKWLQQHTNVI